jgi:hypothetical protein
MNVRVKSGTYGQTNERAVYRKGVKLQNSIPTILMQEWPAL